MFKRPHSISRQLLFGLGATVLIFWAVASALAYNVMREEMGEVFDSALQETAERLAPLVISDLFAHDDNEGVPRRVTALRSSIPDEYLTYQVRDDSGRVLLHSHNVSAKPYEAPLQAGFWDGEHQRIFTTSAVSGTIFVQVADSLDHRQEAALEAGGALLLPLILLLPLVLFAVGWLVRRNISEVDRLRSMIAFRDGGNLTPLDLKDLPLELLPIQQSVNLLIQRVAHALDAERVLTANSAHELRTPIAGAMAQSQLLISELSPGPSLVRARQVHASLQTLSALTEKLLQLARADAGIGLAAEESDLASVLKLVIDEFSRFGHGGKHIVFEQKEARSLLKRVDADAFAIAVRNILENAIKHGLEDEPVTVQLRPDAVTVVNVTETQEFPPVESLKERFVRGKTSTPGSGLGLAIADRLAEQMGAKLELKVTNLPAGRSQFAATILFPS